MLWALPFRDPVSLKCISPRCELADRRRLICLPAMAKEIIFSGIVGIICAFAARIVFFTLARTRCKGADERHAPRASGVPR